MLVIDFNAENAYITVHRVHINQRGDIVLLTNKQLQQELARFPDELEIVLVSFAGDKEDYQTHDIDCIHDKWEGIGLEDKEGPVLAIEFRRDQISEPKVSS